MVMHYGKYYTTISPDRVRAAQKNRDLLASGYFFKGQRERKDRGRRRDGEREKGEKDRKNEARKKEERKKKERKGSKGKENSILKHQLVFLYRPHRRWWCGAGMFCPMHKCVAVPTI